MAFVAVEYVYDPALAEEMAQVRPAHREFLASLFEQGKLVASGPFTEADAPGALILLAVEDVAAGLELLEADPFFQANLIAGRSARAWNPVIGEFAGR
ncbi:YciI family protein [Buchananella felis]|uniref:YciI family protein n=1 Tax=Buchananella felis TaxID=3231492 RepID=UPI003527E148